MRFTSNVLHVERSMGFFIFSICFITNIHTFRQLDGFMSNSMKSDMEQLLSAFQVLDLQKTNDFSFKKS